jgi:hypothetical protein
MPNVPSKRMGSPQPKPTSEQERFTKENCYYVRGFILDLPRENSNAVAEHQFCAEYKALTGQEANRQHYNIGSSERTWNSSFHIFFLVQPPDGLFKRARRTIRGKQWEVTVSYSFGMYLFGSGLRLGYQTR